MNRKFYIDRINLCELCEKADCKDRTALEYPDGIEICSSFKPDLSKNVNWEELTKMWEENL